MPLLIKSIINIEKIKKIKVKGVDYDIAHEGVLKNSGFEVVTALPRTGLFAGREVIYNGKKYVYSSGWKEQITANTMYEDKLLYNIGSVVNEGSVIDLIINSSGRANVYAYTKPNAISVQYSQDAGASWSDYDLSDIDKQNLCTFSKSIYCGGPDVTHGNINYRLRVNLFPRINNISIFHKLNLIFSYSSSYNRWLTVRCLHKSQEDIDANYVTIIDKASISSSTGRVVVNLGNIDVANEYDKVVLDMGYDGVGTGKGLSLKQLKMFSIYANPYNALAKNDSMYTYDINKKSIFDGAVESKEVINFNVNNIEPTQTGSSVVKTSTWLWQYLVQAVNWLRANTVRLSDYNVQVANLDKSSINQTQVSQITSFDNLDWYNEQVSEYEVDSNTTTSIINGTTLPATVLFNCSAEQLTLNLYPISGKQYGKGSLDSLITDLQGKGFSVFVENDLDAILASGSDYLVRVKISKVPIAKAIIEYYVARLNNSEL